MDATLPAAAASKRAGQREHMMNTPSSNARRSLDFGRGQALSSQNFFELLWVSRGNSEY